MKKLLILPLALFLLVQSGLAQTPKWVEKAKRAVFSVITYDKNDKMLNTGNGFFDPKTDWLFLTTVFSKGLSVR